MNVSILVSGFKYLNFFNLTSSLAIWIYHELLLIKYTDIKLVNTFTKKDFEAAESIIYLCQNEKLLIKLFLNSVDDYKSFDKHSDKDSAYQRINLILKYHKINAKNRRKVLDNASYRGYIETVQLLLANDLHIDKSSSLCVAAENGNLEIVKLLLDAGTDVHSHQDYSIILSACNDHIEVVKLLIEYGADIHINNDQPLISSCCGNRTEVVKILLEHGADIHANDDESLIQASWRGNIETVKILLEHGADIHAKDDEALISSCENIQPKVVKLLLEHGADIHARSDILKMYTNFKPEVVNVLQEYGLYIN